MSTKTTKHKAPVFRYAPEDLEPRDVAADEKFIDDFIARNRNAIDEGLRAARASLRAGRGKAYESSEALATDILGKLRRPSRKN